MNIQDRRGSLTAEELRQKYNLDALVKDRKAIENTTETLTQLNNEQNNMIEAIVLSLSGIELQDNISLWFYSEIPTLENEPSINWTDNEIKNSHIGDLYFDRDTGYVYQFDFIDEVFLWKPVTETNLIQAMALSNAAIDTSDRQRKIFLTTPAPPYSNGDWYIKDNGDLYICQISKTEEEVYNEYDFIIASKYALGTDAIETNNKIVIIAGQVTTIIESIDLIEQSIEDNKYYVDEEGVKHLISTATSTLKQDVSSIEAEVESIGNILTDFIKNVTHTGDYLMLPDTPKSSGAINKLSIKGFGNVDASQDYVGNVDASQDYDIIQTLTFAEASGTCNIRLHRGSFSAYTGTVKIREGTSGAWSDLSVSGTATTFNVTNTTMQIAHDWNKSGNDYMTCSFYGQSTNLTGIAISQKAVLSGVIGNFFMYMYAVNCTSLTTLDVPNTSNITSVGDDFMSGYATDCSGLTSLSVPNTSGVTSVGVDFMYDYAFGCSNLTSLDVPDTSSITSVGGYFMSGYAADCSALTMLVLPSVGWFATNNVDWGIPSGRLTYLKGEVINGSDLAGWQALTTPTSPNTLYLNYIKNTADVNTANVSFLPLYPGMTYPSEYTFPGVLSFYTLIFDTISTFDNEPNYVFINSPIPLQKLGTVYDELIIEANKVKVIQRIGYDDVNEEWSVLSNPITHELNDVLLPTFDGDTFVSVKYFDNLIYDAEYLIKNDLTSNFSTQLESSSHFKINQNEIEAKVNRDGIISSINLSPEEIKILAEKINIEGLTTINNNFKVLLDGSIEAVNAKLTGDIFLPNGGRVIGGDGILGNLQYEFRNYGWMFPDGSDIKNGYWLLGYNTEFYSETGVWKNYIMSDVYIPTNFTVTEAKIKLLHANVRWDNGSAQAWGYCRNLRVYKVTNSNNFEVYAAYASGGDDGLIWSKSEISNAFGSSGFTAPVATNFGLVETESADISSSLNTGNNKIIIQTSNAPGAFTTDPDVAITRFGPHTGYVYALINIKGYMKT